MARTVGSYCPGCDGRCAVGIGAARLAPPGSLDVPAAAASLRALRRGALRVFAPAVVAVAGMAVFAHLGAWSDWHLGGLVLAALGSTPLLARLRRG